MYAWRNGVRECSSRAMLVACDATISRSLVVVIEVRYLEATPKADSFSYFAFKTAIRTPRKRKACVHRRGSFKFPSKA